MITRCDHCGSKFEVSAELIYSNDPGVRCGECMSLFDARANLFNEAEHRKTANRLKPVQKKKPVEKVLEAADQDFLETADTVAVEHIYTSAGAKYRASDNMQGIVDNGSFDNTTRDSSARLNSNDLPEYRSEQVPEYRSNEEYRSKDKYLDDIEFERTLATDSALPDRADIADADSPRSTGLPGRENIKETIYRNDGRLPDRPAVTDQHVDDRDTAGRKQQDLREREQRALQMEPERDFESLSSIDVALDESMAAERGEELARSGAGKRSRSDDRDVALDENVINRGDTHFIPDDVLSQPAVIRDNGRRSEEAIRFKPDTPEFDISLDDDRHTKTAVNRDQQQRTSERYSAKSADDQKEIDQRGSDLSEYDQKVATRDSAIPDSPRRAERDQEFVDEERVNAESEHLSDIDSRYNDLHTSEYEHLRKKNVDRNPAVRVDSSSVSESSAQEMRRYQQYRPSVEVKPVGDEVAVQSAPHEVTQQRTGAGALFWMAGLIVAIGLLLFAARGIIGNMNLPEPVISGFCQLTGCVPDQAKKDVSRLQVMRKRLYPHPELENALVISVDVVNNSIYKQPLPTLAVSVLNASDEIVAERDFASADYEVVDASEVGYLMPDEPTRLMIEVVDTDLGAADVELTFK